MKEGKPGTELVDEEGVGLEVGELRRHVDLKNEVELAQNGAENREAGEYGGRDDGVASDTNIEGTWRINLVSRPQYNIL